MKKLRVIAIALIISNMFALENNTIPAKYNTSEFQEWVVMVQSRYKKKGNKLLRAKDSKIIKLKVNKAFELVCGKLFKEGDGLPRSMPRSATICASYIKILAKFYKHSAPIHNERGKYYWQKFINKTEKIIEQKETIKLIQKEEEKWLKLLHFW